MVSTFLSPSTFTTPLFYLFFTFTQCLPPKKMSVHLSFLHPATPTPAPSQISTILQHVAKKEGVRVPPELVGAIAAQSGRNLRRAVLQLETMKVMQQRCAETGRWEKECVHFCVREIERGKLESKRNIGYTSPFPVSIFC